MYEKKDGWMAGITSIFVDLGIRKKIERDRETETRVDIKERDYRGKERKR